MKTENSNRVNMINANITCCDANTAATAGIPSFVIILGSVKSKMVLINSLNQIAEGTTKGVTLDTNVLRKEMTALALKCANATLAYANSIHNNTLAALVNYSETKLNSLKKEDVDDVCEAIHDATDANFAGATNFGVIASDVTDLQAAIDLYRTASQNPRQAIISKSQAKKKVTKMIREVIDDLLVAQLDKMVNTLKTSNKDFFDAYKQSREIIDLGKTTAKVRGTVLDENDAPIKGVLFSITETGTGKKIGETQTDVKGKYGITKLPVGDFDFEWSKNGYITVTEENVHISAGKDLRRKIVMEQGGKTAVREGDVMMGMIANINVDGIDASKNSIVLIEVFGSPLRFYASQNPNDAPVGTFLDVQPGMPVQKNVQDMAAALGFNDTSKAVNVQNVGAMQGHYKITFSNLK